MSKDADVDEVLLYQARRGDPAAFEKFATRWWTPVYRIAWNMLGSASEAAEATEQTLMLVIRFPESVGYHAPFGICLRGAAIDVSLLRCPGAGRSPAESLDLADGMFQQPDLGERIRGMLQRLDDLDRAAFVLREVEQFSVEETVAILRMPADQVRARTHRARLLLTGLLGRRSAGAASHP